jgi:hypothetical protein
MTRRFAAIELSSALYIVFAFGVGIMAVILAHMRIYVPVGVSVSLIGVVAWYHVSAYRRGTVGPLTLLLFVTYALPFIHTVPYTWFDFAAPPPLAMWGLIANPYMVDEDIVRLMSMMGAVGAVGFMAGTVLLRRTVDAGTATSQFDLRKSLSVPMFIAWIFAALMLSWIKAPGETIFVSNYGESAAPGNEWNFGSSWMISYAFLLFCLGDAMYDPVAGKLKRKVVLFAFLVIVVWFQLLRGDRESLPCVVAALLMYYVWGQGLRVAVTAGVANKKVLFAGFFAIALISFVIALLRSRSESIGTGADLLGEIAYLRDLGVFRLDNLIHGTWSGVLLTPLSTAGSYLAGTLSLNFGQTYLDFLLSSVPGVVADLIGFVRPIDALRGPAYEMRYGLGGTHAVVVPFMNFRMAGIFFVIALWSFVFALVERRALKSVNVQNLALLGVIAMAAPHWLWYGEKNIMTALIIWFLLDIFYKMCRVSPRRRSWRFPLAR